jgi:hypothetical protein
MIAEDAHPELIEVKKMSKKKSKNDFTLHFNALS